jgi:threonine/homoserine/homoserine lactone efflux protein
MVFIPTFIAVSITPGMCMTLAMSLGMSVGLKRALWMMGGELVGVAIVAVASVVGVAVVMLQFPEFFVILKLVGGIYLIYLGLQLWRSRGKMAVCAANSGEISRKALALQGFVTAVANPKGWAFFIALLPPFIDASRPLASQLTILLSIILSIEFLSLLLYALGGSSLRKILQQERHVKTLNKIAGMLMIGVGVWLILE